MNKIVAYFDGAVEPFNPGGHGGFGVLVLCDNHILLSEAVYIGRWPELSNNVAEYCGAIAVLRYFLREGITAAKVYGDANIVINQLNGRWKARRGAYLPYYHEAYTLRHALPGVSFVWVPREMNGAADELSKQAITTRPLVKKFELDNTLELIPLPTFKPRKRKRDMREVPLSLSDDAWETFKLRYGSNVNDQLVGD